MKIDEAIEILEHAAKVPKIPKNPDLNKAQRLGAEALKRVKSERSMGSFSDRSLLQGETEE